MSTAPAPTTIIAEKPAGTPSESQLGMKPIGEIKVSQMAPPAEPPKPAKPGTAKEGMANRLREKFGEPSTTTPAATTDKKTPVADPKAAPPVAASDDDEAGLSDETKAIVEATKKETDPKKKVNPWKLLDEHKKKTKEYEAKLKSYEDAGANPAKIKELTDALAAREARHAELEREIEFVNFQKSEKFANEYQKPYEEAWKTQMTELSEVTVRGDDGNERAMTSADLLELVNLPLKEAKQRAIEKFGDFADDVISSRKEIRVLLEKQHKAIDDAKKAGLEFFKKQKEEAAASFGKVSEEIRSTWAAANQAAQADEKVGHFFRPVEGDAEGNQRLAKGFELADRAFSENPMNAKTAEERAAIVKRHAAVRNRCAAFGRLTFQNGELQRQLKEAQEKLATYNQAEPPAGGGQRAPAAPAGGGSAKSSMLERLRAKAK
jgi:hypothetical protein